LKRAVVGLIRLFHSNQFASSPASYPITLILEQNGRMRNAGESNCSVSCHVFRQSDAGGREANNESRSGTIRLPSVSDGTAEIRQSGTPLVASNLRESGKFSAFRRSAVNICDLPPSIVLFDADRPIII
jgi:hypothetical protein